jgi:hypothetical protein
MTANHLRLLSIHFNLCAHFLDLRCLLVETPGELRNCRLEVFLLLGYRRFQFSNCRFMLLNLTALFLDFAVFFKKLIEQHCIHRIVANV